MLVLTINEARTTITVKSDLLSDFSGISSVTLKIEKDCEDIDTLTILEGDIVNTDEFVVDAADLSLTEFAQGVWGFALLQVDDSDVLTPEYNCLFVETDLNCKVAAYRNSTLYTETQKIKTLLDYAILTKMGGCASDCVDYCVIYKNLIDVLAESDCS